MIKLTILDGHAVNPGDLSWDMFKEFADVTVYERTPAEKLIERIGNSDAIFLNKITITEKQKTKHIEIIFLLLNFCSIYKSIASH